MKGKHFVFMSEPDEGGATLNWVYEGNDVVREKVTGRDLYGGSKEIVEFDVQAKCHLMCNDKPKVNSTDRTAPGDRLKVIDFPKQVR
jgi:hypothetical protein